VANRYAEIWVTDTLWRISAAAICSKPSSLTRSAIAGTGESSRGRQARSVLSVLSRSAQVTRVLSGAVLVVLTITLVWFAPPMVFLLAGEALLVLGFVEYVSLARGWASTSRRGRSESAWRRRRRRFRGPRPRRIADRPRGRADDRRGCDWRARPSQMAGGNDALPLSAASVFPILYLGLPVGALVAIRETRGPQGLFLLMLTVMVSDTAQYYTGRMFGRRPLAPAISRRKPSKAPSAVLCSARC